jgi:NADH:ubiquinone oxidoreductase subunit 5 (subunit L)/multisubunit Na+/H+ antiporter MnhA subunit
VDLFLGFGKTLISGLGLSLYYVIGYFIAKKSWNIRLHITKEQLKNVSRIISIILIIGSLILGWYILTLSADANNFKGISKEVPMSLLSDITFTIGIIIMLSGFGIVISGHLNFRMIYLLYAETLWNVKGHSPNKLYMKCMSRTIIWMFFFWLFMELYIPPIGNKKKGRAPGKGIDLKLDKMHWERTKKIKPQFIPKAKNLVYNEWKKENLVVTTKENVGGNKN